MTALADLRHGGRWTLAQRAKNQTIWLGASAALALCEHLSPPVLRVLGVAVGALAYALVGSARRVALEGVAIAFPELDANTRRELVVRTYRVLGARLGETVAALRPSCAPPPLPFAPGARACLDEALGEGRGVVFASAHLGPWEHVAASLVQGGLPLTVVAREPYDPRFSVVYDRVRAGVRTVYRGAPGAGASLVRVLRRGEMLGIPMDLASRVPSVDVPFLGRPAPTPVGPARLALRTGAAVVVGTAAPDVDPRIRPEGGPRTVDPGTRGPRERLVIAATRIPSGDLAPGEAGERELTARINEELSARIRAMPDEWPWMHPRWRHRGARDVGQATSPPTSRPG